jgi:hypothetical protein
MARPLDLEFPLESKLLEVLKAYSGASGVFGPAHAELLLFSEVQLGTRIPDLVIVRETRKVAHAQTVTLTAFESWIVGELMRSGAMREPMLTRRLFTLEGRVSSALRRLIKRGVIQRDDSGSYALVSNFSSRFEVVAVEAKLTRWREAIEQAKDYRTFSNQSFIALPESVIDRNPTIPDACEDAGVGLVAVTPSDVELVVEPGSSTPEDPRQWVWLLAKTGALRL